jgi:hypothetical protein
VKRLGLLVVIVMALAATYASASPGKLSYAEAKRVAQRYSAYPISGCDRKARKVIDCRTYVGSTEVTGPHGEPTPIVTEPFSCYDRMTLLPNGRVHRRFLRCT